MVANRKASRIKLSADERSVLDRRVRRRKIAHADAQRAEIILRAADGLNNCEIADAVGVTRHVRTVWRATPTASAISQLFSPSAARRMISARCASARAILRRRTRRSSTARSSAVSLILLAFRLATIAPESLIR